MPGAHEGKGLGNKFLDDLRHADALVHVVDVSGTTDAEGETAFDLCGGRYVLPTDQGSKADDCGA